MQSFTSRNASASHSQGLSLSSIKSKASPLGNTRKRPRALEEWDELDLMICHEEFTSLVALVEKVKVVQERIHRESRASPDLMDFYDHHKPSVPKSCLSAGEVLAVVERMREQLSYSDMVIRRGSYPVTDATMDDNFSILQKELDFCESCLCNHDRQLFQGAKIASPHSQPGISHVSTSPITPSSATTTTTTTTPSTTKYSKWQSDILLQWLVDNHKDPTMSRHDLKELAHRTSLTTSQVSTWLQNMKRRRKKNTIDGTKKATHFLDFLFLANERDENNGKLPPCVEISAYETPRKNDRGQFPARDFIPYTPSPDQARSSYITMNDDDNFSVNPDSLFSGLGTVTESFESLPVDPTDDDEDLEAKDLLSLFASTWYEVQDQIVASPTWNSQSSKSTPRQDYPEIHPNINTSNSDLIEARDDFEGIDWDDFDFWPSDHFRMELAKIKVQDFDVESQIEKDN